MSNQPTKATQKWRNPEAPLLRVPEVPLLRVPEAAALASVSERTINAWLADGTLRKVRLPGLTRSVRVDRYQLLKVIGASMEQPL